MKEGGEGARTRGLQKSNPWYLGRLTTPRNHPHTLYRQWATWRMSLLVRTWLFTQLWRRISYGYNNKKNKNKLLRHDKYFVQLCTANRETQLNTNHPRVIIPQF